VREGRSAQNPRLLPLARRLHSTEAPGGTELKNPQKVVNLAAATCCLAAMVCSPASAFELSPLPTQAEVLRAKKNYNITFRLTYPAIEWGIHTFSNAVHEALTHQAYECDFSVDVCSDVNLDFASSGVIAGVRWNDDPPFRFAPGQGRYVGCPADGEKFATISFALHTDCWLAHFRDVSKVVDRRRDAFLRGRGTMLARSHFGDMQFLHSMASSAGVSATATREAILMWAEFTWRVQSRKADNISGTIRMGQVPVAGIQQYFPATEERTIVDLFTVGRPWLRHQLEDLAFGSLMHMVQDSFSKGHAARGETRSGECGVPPIVKFFTYAGQDKNAHRQADTRQAAASGTSVLVDVLKELVRLRSEKASWQEVRPYLEECVYSLADPKTVSTFETSK
jgi:hypothetical protein